MRIQMVTYQTTQWALLTDTPYSPDLAPGDYHLFTSLKTLTGPNLFFKKGNKSDFRTMEKMYCSAGELLRIMTIFKIIPLIQVLGIFECPGTSMIRKAFMSTEKHRD